MVKATLSGRRVSEERVRSIEQPDFTKSWHPYSHEVVIDVLEASVKQENLVIGKKEYSLTRNGTNMFGVWTVENVETKEVCLALGFRNSVSKQLSLAIGGGLEVSVCSNLIFRAQFTEFRRHTASLSNEIMVVMIRKIIHRIADKDFDELVNWHENLKSFSLSESQSAVLMMRMLRNGIVPATKLYKLVYLYEKSERYDQTLYGFHGACTETVKEDSLFTNEWRNRQIAELMDEAVLDLY